MTDGLPTTRTRTGGPGRLPRVDAVLRLTGWSVIAVGSLVAAALPGSPDETPVSVAVLVTLVLSFVVVLARLVLATVAAPRSHTARRRVALLLLVGAIAVWALGSGVLAATATVEMASFPSPSEALFLLAYVLLAGYVVAEAPWERAHRTRVTLEAAVLFGAGACLTAVAVLTPAQLLFDVEGVHLLLAALWPMLDLLFVGLVVVQSLLGQRERSRRTVFLVAGLLCLAGADGVFLVMSEDGAYTTSLLADLLWGAGFGLLAEAACRVPRPADVQHSARQRPAVMLGASAVGLLVLLVAPAGTVGWTAKVPAAVTLACAGALLAASLREANRSAEAFRLSRTDELTGLANRRAVLADLAALVGRDGPLAFLLLDLDGFKDINDTLGHGAGDDVLRTLGSRMRDHAESDVSVYRLGGDEFALVVRDDDLLRLHELAEEVRDSLGEPLTVAGLEVVVHASVGIATRTEAAMSASDLMRRADVAMYEAKASRAGTLVYDAAQDGFSRERLQITEGLRRALAGDELEMWYQPQVDARTGAVLGLEALLRWRHPQLGVLAPVDFLGQARMSGLMSQVTELVLQQVSAAASAWARAGLDLRVSLNCAPPELLSSGFQDRVAEVVAASGLPRDALLIEVTEDSFLADPHAAHERLQHLREVGVQVSIDDYGTGFSSLAYLRDLPVQELKIDRSFVATLRTDRRSRVIVQTTTQMAHALGLRVVAEGVEDERTAHELLLLDVDVLQGYHVARPMPAADVLRWIAAWSPSSVALPA